MGKSAVMENVNQPSIGVDDLFQAKGRWWCHMVCDDFSPTGLEHLHRFAETLGLSPRAFHNPDGQPRPHYDLTPEYREKALAHGALLLTRRGLVEYLQRGRACLSSPTLTAGGDDGGLPTIGEFEPGR